MDEHMDKENKTERLDYEALDRSSNTIFQRWNQRIPIRSNLPCQAVRQSRGLPQEDTAFPKLFGFLLGKAARWKILARVRGIQKFQ